MDKKIDKYVKGFYLTNTVMGFTIFILLLILSAILFMVIYRNPLFYFLSIISILIIALAIRNICYLKLNLILLKNCDTVTFLEASEKLLNYGRNKKIISKNKNLLAHSEYNYVTALLNNEKTKKQKSL